MCFVSEEPRFFAVETNPARQHKADAEGGDEDVPAVGVDGRVWYDWSTQDGECRIRHVSNGLAALVHLVGIHVGLFGCKDILTQRVFAGTVSVEHYAPVTILKLGISGIGSIVFCLGLIDEPLCRLEAFGFHRLAPCGYGAVE